MRFRAELVALAIILGTAAAAAAGVSMFGGQHQTSALPTRAPATPVRTPTPVPAVVAGPLDGRPTPRAAALRRPIAVVLDNFYPDGRPQSGLAGASVVYEAVTEGGITRLLAVFLEHAPRVVGPVRSARPYFVQWAAGYRAALVHAGGSPASLRTLRRLQGVQDLNALSSRPVFSRDPSRTSPHDLYVNIAGARTGHMVTQLDNTLSDSWMRFKRPAALSARGPGRTITVDFSTPAVASPPEYRVVYQYNRRTNRYGRSVGGLPATDLSTKNQLSASNVVVLFTAISPISNDPFGRVTVKAGGQGRALYLLDGKIVRGTWAKAGAAAPLILRGGRGGRIALNPGQTWVEVVAQGAVRFGK